MTLSEFEIKRCEKLVAEFISKRRPPPHIRAKLDLAFRIRAQSIEIFEIRPHWNEKGKTVEQSVAKATYNRTKGNWKILWQRADLKWHGYQPNPTLHRSRNFWMSLIAMNTAASSASCRLPCSCRRYWSRM